ncbi:MAG: RDD family protein [Luteolibacter sp.]
MDIWIIRDGEKAGPLHDFEIRKKIESGELPASTLAWHEGLDAWKPLKEINIFSREFEVKEPPPLPLAIEPEAKPGQNAARQETFYIRRFWARWLDLTLYSGFWWLGLWAVGQNIEGTLLNPWVMFVRYVPWFALEALLIHKYATTPGKWLLGLRVTNKNDSLLDLGEAIRRSLRVMFTGVGFGWSILAIFCQALSVFTARRLGTTLWDHTGGHQVTAAPLNPFRIISLVFLFAGGLLLQIVVVFPYAAEVGAKQNPELKGTYEKILPYMLPKRSAGAIPK